jgi:hypothetical protein
MRAYITPAITNRGNIVLETRTAKPIHFGEYSIKFRGPGDSGFSFGL